MMNDCTKTDGFNDAVKPWEVLGLPAPPSFEAGDGYVYIWMDRETGEWSFPSYGPRPADREGWVFVYVGIGTDGGEGKYGRSRDHVRRGEGSGEKKAYFAAFGSRMDCTILVEGISKTAKIEYEKLIIAFVGRRDLSEGTLLNATNGGDGAVGVISSPEMLAKRKATLNQPEHLARLRALNWDRPPEERRKNSKKGADAFFAKTTPEQRSEISRKANTARHANTSPKQRSEWARTMNAARTPEERRESARKAKATYLANSTHEQRSEISRKAQATLTPEQRSEAVRKGNATRKAKALAAKLAAE
jgi:hypothetical protein